MSEQIVEYKNNIEFSFTLNDLLEVDSTVRSSKFNIGHLLWSIKVKQSKRHLVRYCVQFERQFSGKPAEFKLDAYLDSAVMTTPDIQPERDYQYNWNESLRFDSAKDDPRRWHSEWRWLELDVLENSENEFLDDKGRVHIWVRVEIYELSNFGRPDRPDLLIVNGETFNVNKYILAGHSPFFRAFFFKDGFKEFLTQNFEISDPEVNTVLFGMMLDIVMAQTRSNLDDDHVEGLLQLSDKYDILCVKENCEKFLINSSDKPKIFKFRMAESYGLVALKGKMLRSLDPREFCSNFGSNVAEFIKLGEKSKRTWDSRMSDIAFMGSDCDVGKRRRYSPKSPPGLTRYSYPSLPWHTAASTSRPRSPSTIRTLSRSPSYQLSDSTDHPPTDAADASFSP